MRHEPQIPSPQRRATGFPIDVGRYGFGGTSGGVLMSARIEWSNEMHTTQPRTIGRLPKKAVVWIGEIWLTLPSGEKDIRAWRSNQPITTDQARTVLGQLLSSLIGEHGKDSATNSGFWCRSR